MGETLLWSTVGRYSSSGRVTMMFAYLTDQMCLSVNMDKVTMKPAIVWDYLHGADRKECLLQMYLEQQKWCARQCVKLFKGVPICSVIIHQSLEADEPPANFGQKDIQKSISLVYPASFPSNEPIMLNRMLVLEMKRSASPKTCAVCLKKVLQFEWSHPIVYWFYIFTLLIYISVNTTI